MFECPQKDQVMFYLNKTEANINSTVCLYSAQWKKENELECWTGKL